MMRTGTCSVDGRKQRGASLFIALVALLALTFAGLAMVRTMDTAGLIAGNFSFRQASLNVADLALESALVDLEHIYIAAGRDNNYPPSCSTNCSYYAWYTYCGSSTASPCDAANGVSTRIDWTNASPPSTPISFTALGTGYAYKYVIERLCDASQSATAVVTTNVNLYCYSMTLYPGYNSQESRSALLGAVKVSNEVAYRVTIQITGPRNTSAMVQAILMKN